LDPRAVLEQLEMLELRDCQEPLEHRVLMEQLVQPVLLVNLVPREQMALKVNSVSLVTLEHLVAPELRVRLEPLETLEPQDRLATPEHRVPPVRLVQPEALGTLVRKAQLVLPVPRGQLGRSGLPAVWEPRAHPGLLDHRASGEILGCKELRAR